jgi:hypothetical protein
VADRIPRVRVETSRVTGTHPDWPWDIAQHIEQHGCDVVRDGDTPVDGVVSLVADDTLIPADPSAAYFEAVFHSDSEDWEINYVTRADEAKGVARQLTANEVLTHVDVWVRDLRRTIAEHPVSHVELLQKVEEFAELWRELKSELDLDPRDVRIGDAYVLMATEVVKVEDPPTGAMREAFRWFAGKVDAFATAAAKTAGATVGTGAGVVLTGQLQNLQAIARHLIHTLQ